MTKEKNIPKLTFILFCILSIGTLANYYRDYNQTEASETRAYYRGMIIGVALRTRRENRPITEEEARFMDSLWQVSGYEQAVKDADAIMAEQNK